MKRLRNLLEDSAMKQGVNLDPDVHDSLVDTMKANEAEVEKAFPQGSFRRQFWQKQFEAANKQFLSDALAPNDD